MHECNFISHRYPKDHEILKTVKFPKYNLSQAINDFPISIDQAGFLCNKVTNWSLF